MANIAKKASVKVAKKATREPRGARRAPGTASAAKKARAQQDGIRATAEQRHHMIAEAAYYRAEGRGFVTGYETEDWLAAEAFVDSLLGSEKA